MARVRTKSKLPPLGDEEVYDVRPARDPAAPLPAQRPALISSRELARAGRDDSWVEVRCIARNCHTSVDKLLSGQTAFLPADEAAQLDAADLVKLVTTPAKRMRAIQRKADDADDGEHPAGLL